MNVRCYLIDDTCYYVTALQDLVLKKFHGKKKNKFIKKTSYTSGKLGEPVKSPDGNNYLAVIYPEGYKPEVEEKVEVEEPKVATPQAPLVPTPTAPEVPEVPKPAAVASVDETPENPLDDLLGV